MARRDDGLLRQAGTIPWRRDAVGELEVLLVTTRRRGRWTLPKGDVPRSLDPRDAALREAREEAGVSGVVGALLGSFARRKEGRGCIVELYPMRVVAVHRAWPEQAERRREWMPVGEAVRRVSPEAACALIELLAARLDRAMAASR
ncbi:MAG TPA: NUDIX hydrolase [Phycisphaerales bacterium]|nr:NUDIX hydrolase [Phycisphaerales bacterium]HMP38233.1 NUDIX hydrolase [Phycisphaerales bacterium]